MCTRTHTNTRTHENTHKQACCAPLHDGATRAATPEVLLRSRYTAYVAKNPEYIAETTHPDRWAGLG